MFQNYLKIAIRNLWKQKFHSVVNIFGLAVGLTCVLLISLYVVDELSFDRFHKKSGNIYRVVENQYYAGQPVFPVAVTPGPLAPKLKEEYPEIINATRMMYNNSMFEVDEKKFVEIGAYVDNSFFQIFSFPIVTGDPETALNKVDAIVINQTLANKYFGDEDPIGKTIKVNGNSTLEITAVMEDFPQNSHIRRDYLMTTDRLRNFFPGLDNAWGNNTLYTYIEVAPGTNAADLDEKIINQIKKNREASITDIFVQPLIKIHLDETDFTADIGGKGNLQYVRIFSIVALFILLIACINFMNLSTAQSSKRAKEVGLRKAIGARQDQLILQFLGESILMSFLAVSIAVLLADILLPAFNQLAGKELTLSTLTTDENGLSLLIGFVTSVLLTGLMAGIYPAFFLSNFKPILVLKGSSQISNRGSLLRKILVVCQFSISILLIAGTIIVNNQLGYMQDKNLGYNKDNIIYIPRLSKDYQVFKTSLGKYPEVLGVGAANQHPAYVENSTSGISWQGADPDQVLLFHNLGVDYDYLTTMQMELLDGRYFSEEFPSDTTAVIINEEALKIFGFENPIGEKLSGYGMEFTIVGLVKDFHFKSIHTKIEPLIMFKFRDINSLNRIFIRIQDGKAKEAVAIVEKEWKALNQETASNYRFLDDDFNELYQAETTTGEIFSYFSILAILISCLGLFGLASFTTEQRTKEIGIRKVLGANVTNIFYMVAKDFTTLVIIAFVIATPISWFWMKGWLNSFAYRVDIGIWVFLLSGILSCLVALFTVSYHSLNAATKNPVNSLKTE